MPALSRSVTTAQRGRSYTGEPDFEEDASVSRAAEGPGAEESLENHPGGPRIATVTLLHPQGPEDVLPPSRAARRRMSPYDREAGMATAEYAIATLAAVAFAALLVAVLGSGEVRSLLMGLIRSALTLG